MTSAYPTTPPTRTELRRTGRMLTAGTWVLIGAVCTFSAMTGAQFIGAHSPWHWSGWVLAAGIDIAFVMALQADATLARFGSAGGRWPSAFRWLTGAFSVFVNIGNAALQSDAVGIAVHLIAPALLLVLGEAGPAWRRQLVNLERSSAVISHHLSSERQVPTRGPAYQPEVTTWGAHLGSAVRTAAEKLRTLEPPEQPVVPAQPSAHADEVDADDTDEFTVGDGGEHGDHCTVTEPPADAREARSRIVRGRLDGLSQRETARWAHRSPTFVRKIWAILDEDHQHKLGSDETRAPGPGEVTNHAAPRAAGGVG
ncbi:hypothetical protein ABT095_18160 [Kitasatospora sp. NPDC002227]|uniref:hypothetical protein n=1 Tax=Kitasatospora sp. NPDC002227 TaxID=3154773 RepID=UPI003333A6DB